MTSNTRPSHGGFYAVFPSFEDPVVFLWAPTERVAEETAAEKYLPLAVRHEDERMRLEREFEAQERAAYLRIKARA